MNNMEHLDQLAAHERGDLAFTGTCKMFQRLVDTGLAWRMDDPHYPQTARSLIEAGYITAKGIPHEVHSTEHPRQEREVQGMELHRHGAAADSAETSRDLRHPVRLRGRQFRLCQIGGFRAARYSRGADMSDSVVAYYAGVVIGVALAAAGWEVWVSVPRVLDHLLAVPQ